MSRTRSLILLAGSFLLASSAWADDLGYVDCSAHPENTQVFAKPRQTPDSVATVACGERFTILLNGFIFSRVQTKDGKVGYLYSSVITVDHGQAGPAQSAAARPAASAPAAAPAANVQPAVANAATATPASAQPTSAQAGSMPVTTSLPPQKPAASSGPLFPTPPVPAVTAADVNYSSSAQAAPAASSAAAPQPAPSAPASANSTASASTPAPAAPASSPTPAPAASAQPAPPAPTPAAADPQASSSSTPAQSSAPAQPGPLFPTTPPPAPAPPASSTPDAVPASASAAAEPAPSSQPQPEASQPASAPLRSAKVRESWEQPMGGVRQSFLLELFGGYGFARFNSGGVSTNLNGAVGSFGYNFKPWLQLGGDASYDLITINGVKNILYGNHFGVRYFYHRFSRFTPFAEGLVGGSRVDTSGGGVKTSTNCISYKVGGGVDYRASKRWEIRIINVDYYRTSFGSGTGYPGQNNYWASAGVVMRLFGSGASE